MKPASFVSGLLAGAIVAVLAAAPAQDRTARVATVNIRVLFDDTTIPAVRNARAQLEQFIRPRQERIDQLEAEITRLRESLRDAPEGSARQQELRGQLKERLVEHRVYTTVSQEEVTFRTVQLNLEVYRRIREAIAAVGEADGYDIVLRADEFPSENAEPTTDELLRTMRERVVLYAGRPADITARVAERMRREN
jgi:Skp family chaperone for outer membrane proteins